MWAGRLHRAARSSARGQRPANPPILALPLPCAAAAADSRAGQGVGPEGKTGVGKYFHVLQERWLPPPRDGPAAKRPAGAGSAAAAAAGSAAAAAGPAAKKPKRTEGNYVTPQDMAHAFVRVTGDPGDDLEELELRGTTADGTWLEKALDIQQQPLRNMKTEGIGLPDWVVVTSEGLLCRTCISAHKQGLRAGTFNVGENTAWISRYCRRANVRMAIKHHESGQASGISDNTAHKQFARGLARVAKNAAEFEAAEMTAIDKEAAAIKVRLRVLLHVVENNYPLSKFRAELEFLSANGGLVDCPERGKKGSIDCHGLSRRSSAAPSSTAESPSLVTEMPIFCVNLPCTGKIFAAGAHTGGCTPRPPPDRYARPARRYAPAGALRTV